MKKTIATKQSYPIKTNHHSVIEEVKLIIKNNKGIDIHFSDPLIQLLSELIENEFEVIFHGSAFDDTKRIPRDIDILIMSKTYTDKAETLQKIKDIVLQCSNLKPDKDWINQLNASERPIFISLKIDYFEINFYTGKKELYYFEGVGITTKENPLYVIRKINNEAVLVKRKAYEHDAMLKDCLNALIRSHTISEYKRAFQDRLAGFISHQEKKDQEIDDYLIGNLYVFFNLLTECNEFHTDTIEYKKIETVTQANQLTRHCQDIKSQAQKIQKEIIDEIEKIDLDQIMDLESKREHRTQFYALINEKYQNFQNKYAILRVESNYKKFHIATPKSEKELSIGQIYCCIDLILNHLIEKTNIEINFSHRNESLQNMTSFDEKSSGGHSSIDTSEHSVSSYGLPTQKAIKSDDESMNSGCTTNSDQSERNKAIFRRFIRNKAATKICNLIWKYKKKKPLNKIANVKKKEFDQHEIITGEDKKSIQNNNTLYSIFNLLQREKKTSTKNSAVWNIIENQSQHMNDKELTLKQNENEKFIEFKKRYTQYNIPLPDTLLFNMKHNIKNKHFNNPINQLKNEFDNVKLPPNKPEEQITVAESNQSEQQKIVKRKKKTTKVTVSPAHNENPDGFYIPKGFYNYPKNREKKYATHIDEVRKILKFRESSIPKQDISSPIYWMILIFATSKICVPGLPKLYKNETIMMYIFLIGLSGYLLVVNHNYYKNVEDPAIKLNKLKNLLTEYVDDNDDFKSGEHEKFLKETQQFFTYKEKLAYQVLIKFAKRNFSKIVPVNEIKMQENMFFNKDYWCKAGSIS